MKAKLSSVTRTELAELLHEAKRARTELSRSMYVGEREDYAAACRRDDVAWDQLFAWLYEEHDVDPAGGRQ